LSTSSLERDYGSHGRGESRRTASPARRYPSGGDRGRSGIHFRTRKKRPRTDWPRGKKPPNARSVLSRSPSMASQCCALREDGSALVRASLRPDRSTEKGMGDGTNGRGKEVFRLMQEVKSGRRESFEELRKQVRGPLSSLLRHCTRISLLDAENLADEMVEDACSSPQRIQERAKAWNYLVGGVLRSGRRWKKRFRYHADLSPLQADPDSSAQPDRLIEFHDAFEVFWKSLNLQCREILFLRCQELSIPEISQARETNARTVRRRLATIREQARRHFDLPMRGRI